MPAGMVYCYPNPAAALGESVLVEFQFVSDGSVDAFSGLSLDNFELSAD